MYARRRTRSSTLVRILFGVVFAILLPLGHLAEMAAARDFAVEPVEAPPPPATMQAEVSESESVAEENPEQEPGSAQAPEHEPAQDDEQPAGPIEKTELEAFLDGVIFQQRNSKNIAGAAVAVVVDGELFFSKGYGYADIAERKPVDPKKTMFRIGSVSKLFTWTAIMQLVEDGKLDLEADINQYLGEVQIPNTFEEPITLRHLLTHTPGFEDRVIGLFARDANEVGPLQEVLRQQLPARVRPPGKLASYSNHGTALAGHIVAHVTDMPWEEYIEKHFLEPLEMHHTTVRQPPEEKLVEQMSTGYEFKDGQYTAEPFEFVPAAPAGCMSGSAEDMAKFLIAHLHDGQYGSARILESATAQQMRTVLFKHNENVDGTCYGFFEMKRNNQRVLHHGGATFLFHSMFAMLPEHNVGLFVSYNTDTAASCGAELLKTFLDHYYPVPDPPRVNPPADFASRAEKYEGTYMPLRHPHNTLARLQALLIAVDVTAEDDGTLSLEGTGGAKRFVEVEPHVFNELDGKGRLVFRQDSQGRITHAFIGDGPSTALEKLSWYETPLFHYALLGVCGGLFATAIFGWPFVVMANFRMPKRGRRSAFSLLCSWVGWLACLAAGVFLAAFTVAMEEPEEIAFGIPSTLNQVLLLPQVCVALFALMLLCVVVAWKNRYWRITGRVHYTLTALAGAGFAWFLYDWNLLQFGL